MRKAWLSINYTTEPVKPLIPVLVCNGNCKICKDLVCIYI